jgi:hypothetical protein
MSNHKKLKMEVRIEGKKFNIELGNNSEFQLLSIIN